MMKRHFMSKKVVYVGRFGHISEENEFCVSPPRYGTAFNHKLLREKAMSTLGA